MLNILKVLEEKKKKEKRKEKIKNIAKFTIGTTIGTTVGALVGILFAPKAGKETRDDIKQNTENIKKTVIDRAEKTGEQLKHLCENTKIKLNEIKENARHNIVKNPENIIENKEQEGKREININ